MDHWGDPWADDANETTFPPKEKVITPPPPTFSAGPVLLNGFLDDAQWGSINQEEDFGTWATSSNPSPTLPESRVTSGSDNLTEDGLTNARHGEGADERGLALQDEGWGDIEGSIKESRQPDHAEQVVSEASDSATTIQPDDSNERISADFSDILHREDNLSTRSSTSPSDVSHTDAPTESPRTSFEEERVAGNASRRKTADHNVDKQLVHKDKEVTPIKDPDSGGNDFDDFEDDQQVEMKSAVPKAPASPEPDLAIPDSPVKSVRVRGIEVDMSLLAQLFPSHKPSKKLSPAPDDPIYSTSARKAWHRVTRKQTMREFNNGYDDNNYIRVTWTNSKVRSEVGKIVTRWATEDRVSGRGPGAGANFYWDTAKLDSNVMGTPIRKQGSISAPSSMGAAKQHTSPLSTTVPAAFNWSSSPLVSDDPWKQDSPHLELMSSSSEKESRTSKLQKEEARSSSVDLTHHNPAQPAHQKMASISDPLAVHVFPTNQSPEPLADIEPRSNIHSVDNGTEPQPTRSIEDDDEWGEMVESPTFSNMTAFEAVPQHTSQHQTFSTPTPKPRSTNSSLLQQTASKDASPIVRLKGTVSPTSARFGHNSFVPADAEEGPIGQGILKPANKSSEPRPGKNGSDLHPPSSIDEMIARDPAATAHNEFDDFSAFESSTQTGNTSENPKIKAPPFEPSITPPVSFALVENQSPVAPAPDQSTEIPSSPPLASPTPHSSTNPWSTADFSFFESAAPVASKTQISQENVTTDFSDPLSIFDSPVPPAPFSRPEHRPTTPPPKLPLTGASNSAQRRKAEEDELVRSIVDGLPDLGYMLRH